MTAEEWIEAYAELIGVGVPSSEEIEAILELAGVAAHASERIAAPVACWMAADSGTPLAAALKLAKQV